MARQNCSNWFSGKCLGCMPKLDENGLNFRIDGDFAGKDCIVDEKRCDFFEKIVIPGIDK